MVRHTEADDDESTETTEGDTVFIRTDDGVIRATVDEAEYDFERPEDGARMGGTLDTDDPSVHYVDYYHDDPDDDLPEAGDRFVDTVRGDVFTVDRVEDDDRVVNQLVTWEDGTASTSDEFRDDVETGRLVPTTDSAIDTAEAYVESRDDGDRDPVDMAFDEASNDEDTVSVRFMGDRGDDGVSFRVSDSSLYKAWYSPDKIIAEHFDVEDGIDAALEVLRNDADLRSVRESRVGAFRFDRETGEAVDVSIYGVDVDDEDATKRRMLRCFDDDR